MFRKVSNGLERFRKLDFLHVSKGLGKGQFQQPRSASDRLLYDSLSREALDQLMGYWRSNAENVGTNSRCAKNHVELSDGKVETRWGYWPTLAPYLEETPWARLANWRAAKREQYLGFPKSYGSMFFWPRGLPMLIYLSRKKALFEGTPFWPIPKYINVSIQLGFQ